MSPSPSPDRIALRRAVRHTVLARDLSGDQHPGRSWRKANQARLRHGRRAATAMLLLRLNHAPGQTIADAFGVSRGAVYARLHRLRQGYYNR